MSAPTLKALRCAAVLLLSAAVVAPPAAAQAATRAADAPARAPINKDAEAIQAIDKAEMAEKVRQMFLHAWNSYKQHAWGHDELRPLSKTGRNWHAASLLMTPVDALSTMLLMGLDEEAAATREYIATHLSFDHDIEVKHFEIVIRILGGLLSSYQTTGDERLLEMATDLAERMLPAFDSPTGMPYMYINLKTGQVRGAVSNPAEIGTLVIEYGALSKFTGNPVYFDKAKRALVGLYERRSKLGLVGQSINVETGEWTSTRSHISGLIDSYYEYLLKCSILFDDEDCGEMWRTSIAALNRHLAHRVKANSPELWYGTVDMHTGERAATRFGALDAFWPGVLALSGDTDRARSVQESVYKMWTTWGIEPEQMDYVKMEIISAGYVLRPEAIESAYILYYFTQNPHYLEMGVTFYESLEKYCRTEAGYAALRSVVTKEKRDNMESFFLAETLKYLYLLFASPDTLDLSKTVFNTEAHPIRKDW